MVSINRERMAAETDGEYVVYTNGTRLNRLRALPKYLRAAIQYWRSLEDIGRFARDPDGPHVPAWRRYDEEVSDGGGRGFWTELSVVRDGAFETF